MAFQRPPAANLVTPAVDPNALFPVQYPSTVVGTFTGTGNSDIYKIDTGHENGNVFQVEGATASGAGTAEVKVYGRITRDSARVLLATISLTLSTTASSDGFWTPAPWPFIEFECSGLTGTGAYVTCYIGG